jgi:epsilon-lactone hydrolase
MSLIRLFMIKRVLRRVKQNANYTNIIGARKGFERMVSKFNNHLSGFSYRQFDIHGMKCEWINPDGSDATRVLLYFHGGGYATGSINTHRALVSQIARYAGIQAMVIDYRLAPEHKYPAPIEDAVKAYEWLLAEGFLPQHIAFGGDSAGGGITLGTLLYLRDHNRPLPQCAIALSPWTDLTLSGQSYHEKKDHDPMLVHEAFPLWVKNYMGDTPPDAPYASPLLQDLKGLPSIYIQVGEEEMLLSDSVEFGAKAQTAGVHVTLEVFAKKFHVFNAFWRVLPKAREANKKLGHFVHTQLTAIH